MDNLLVISFGTFLGIHNWKHCPVQPKLPIFLVGQGGISILIATMLLGIFCCCNDDAETPNKRMKSSFCIVILSLLLQITWQAFGCKWVFLKWKDYNDTLKCDSEIYMLSFSILAIMIGEYFFAFMFSICALILKNIAN